MLRVSVARPSLFRGLVLVGPTLRAAQWGESLSLRAIARKLAQGGREGAKAAASAVSGFHLSRRADRGCASALAGGLQELNPRNVGAFVAAYKTRSVLQGGALKPIKQAGLRVFLAVGNCSDGVLPMVPLENRTEVAAELQVGAWFWVRARGSARAGGRRAGGRAGPYAGACASGCMHHLCTIACHSAVSDCTAHRCAVLRSHVAEQRVLESSASSRALDNVNLVTVPACGHLVTREKPRELVAPLAFFLSDAPF
jgi:pimeloyl-ACP methyl ester carboxylesterase